MKMRAGFVSNSSSSSFVVFGNIFDKDQIEKFLKKNKVEISTDNGYGDEEEGEISGYDLAETLSGYLTKLGHKNIEVTFFGEDGDSIGVGRSPFDVGKTQTGQEFRDEVNKVLKLIDPKLKGGHNVEETVYN